MIRFIYIVAILFSSSGFSQDYLDIIAKETCECITTKKIDLEKASEIEVQGALGGCMITSYSVYRDKMSEADRVEYGDSQGMRKLGEKVGVKMLTHCPEQIMKLGNALIEEDEIQSTELTLEGDFVAIKVSDFVTLIIKDSKGRNHSLLLLNHFQNADWITNNQLKKNQKLFVTYSDHEFYDPKTKEYKYYKVLYGLNKI